MKLLNTIQKALKVPKNELNKFGNYKYRSCEDILEAVKPLLGESVLTLTDEVVILGDRFYVKATATLLGAEETYSVTAYAREAQEQKGMAEAQVTGSASSYARKYALNGLFLIDDTKDPDTQDNTPVKPKTAPKTTPKVQEAKPFDGAFNAIEKCQTTAEVDDVLTKITNSKLLTAEEKVQLGELAQERINYLFNSI